MTTHPMRAVLAVGALVLVACGATENSEILLGQSIEAAVAGACTSLSTCCPSLPSDVVTSCKQLATQAGDTECGEEIAALHKDGFCTVRVDAGPLRDAATSASDATSFPTDGSTGDAGAVACTLLAACCSSPALPADEVTSCQSIQGAGAEADCTGLLNTLTASSSCTGTSGSCLQLSACCVAETFPSTFAAQCTSTATGGEESACGADLATFGSAGYCTASGASDGGHPRDPNCATLSMCCNEITFPARTLSTCASLVSGNVGGSCLSAYDSYIALGYCE